MRQSSGGTASLSWPSSRRAATARSHPHPGDQKKLTIRTASGSERRCAGKDLALWLPVLYCALRVIKECGEAVECRFEDAAVGRVANPDGAFASFAECHTRCQADLLLHE